MKTRSYSWSAWLIAYGKLLACGLMILGATLFSVLFGMMLFTTYQSSIGSLALMNSVTMSSIQKIQSGTVAIPMESAASNVWLKSPAIVRLQEAPTMSWPVLFMESEKKASRDVAPDSSSERGTLPESSILVDGFAGISQQTNP